MKLIIGLGNVGERFAGTRHNLGFMVVDRLAAKHQLEFAYSRKLGADVAKGNIDGQAVVLAKPGTMMNLSGGAVAKLAQFYKVIASDIWVVYDEMDLPFGKLRIRERGSDAGHNGVASVAQSIGSDFIRWRIGIGKPQHKAETVDYVLHAFDTQEASQLESLLEVVATSIEDHFGESEIKPETIDALVSN